MKSITKRIISTLAICGALVLEAGTTAIGSLGKALNNIAKVDAATEITIASADVVTNSSYAKYETTVSDRTWLITFGGNNKSVGTNSGNRSKCNLSSYSKYAVSPVSTSDVAAAFAGETKLENIGEISYTFNGGSSQTSTNVYVIYSSDGNSFSQLSLTSGTQGAAISSGTTYKFNSCSGYFALLFKATNSSGNWRIDDVNITFKAVAASKYTVAFNSNGGEGSMDGTGQDSASYTLPSCTFTAPNGKAFDKWALGSTSGTQYSAGSNVTLSEGTNTFYALWKDIEYTDIPAGDYSVTFNANTDTVVPNGNYAIKADEGGKYYKPLVVTSTNATLNSSYHEFTYTKSIGKLEISTASNAKITEVHVGYYKGENGVLKVNGSAASSSTTDVVVPFVGNDSVKYKYTINSNGFTYEVGSDFAGNIFSMVIHLKVEAASGPTDVINEIDALPAAAYTQEFADKLNSALEHYNKLSASDQALVTNHNKLLTAQSSFNELRDAAVANVESLITQIGTVTADSGTKISDARTAYDALLADTLGKSLVSNYSTLTAAEATYQDVLAVKVVEDAIKALPEAANITDYSHHSDIAAARAAYNALTDDQKAMVTASLVTKLEACENAEKPFAPKEVTFYYSDTTTTKNMTGNNDAELLNADATKWEIKGDKGGNNNYPGLNKAGQIRLYSGASNGNTITIKTLITDAKITTLTLNFTDTTDSKFTNSVNVYAGSSTSTVSPINGVYTINAVSVKIENASRSSDNLQNWFDSIVCAYSIPTSSTITYNNLKGATNSNPSTYVEGTGVASLVAPGSITGYTFQGWYDNASYDGNPITSIPTTKTGNVQLWAKWQINSHTYKIVYDNGTADATDTLNYGTTITIPAAPSKTGYEFLNWSDGTNTYNPGATVSMPDEDFTITAKYNVAKYTITFYKAVGEVFTTYTNKEYLSEIDLPSPAPTKEGFTFVGWAEDSSATEASWATGKYQVPAKNVDFYAVFTNAPAITGVTLANTFTSIELTEANSSFSATAEVSITPHSLDTTIDWSVSPADAGTLTNASTNSGVSPIFTASKLYDEVTITATSHGDDNYYNSFTFAIVNPADEYVSDIVINEGTGVRKSYYSSETAVDMTGLTADATYKSTARPLYEDTRDVTSSATWTLDIANKKVIASLGGETDYIAIEVIEDAITAISVDDNTGKREYTIGDEFDYSEVTVTGSYNNPALADEDVTSDCVFDDSAFDSLHEGTYTINVSYKGSETIVDSYTVEVKKATVSEAGWKLVTSNTDLSAGSKYLIVGIKESNYYGIQAYSSGNNIKGSAVNSPDENNFITYDNTKGNAEITLGGLAGNWTLFDGSLYLYAAGGTGNNNWLKGAANADDANAQWTIEIASDGKATIKTADTTVARHTMRFNTNGSNDPLFACYATGQSDVYLYKYVPGSSAKIVGVDAAYTGETTEGTVINNTDSTITFNTITNTGVSTEITDKSNVTLNGGNSVTLVAGLNEIELSYTTGGKTYTGTLKVNATAVTKYDLSVIINCDQADYSISPELTDGQIVAGKTYTLTVTPKEGYKVTSIVSSCGGVSGNTVTLSGFTSDVTVTVNTEKIKLTIDNTNLTNCSITDISSLDIYYGDSVTMKIEPNGSFLAPTSVTIKDEAGNVITPTTAYDPATGYVTFVAKGQEKIVVYASTTDLPVTTNNENVNASVDKATAGESVDIVLSAVDPTVYDVSAIEVTGYKMGGVLVPASEFAGKASYNAETHTLTINEVTGEIEVEVLIRKLPVELDMTSIDSSVNVTSAPEEAVRLGDDVTITLEVANDNFQGLVITVLMDGEDITDAAYLGEGVIYISEVTGDIEVSAQAEQVKYSVTSLEHVSLQGGATQEGWADYKGEFKLFFDPDDGYKVTGISYTNNGVEGSSTAYSPFEVETVNGVLVITPTVEAIEYTITGNESTEDMVEYSFTSEGPYHYGDVVTVSFTVKEGYEVNDAKYSHYTIGSMQYNFAEYGDTSVEITITGDVVISPAVNVIMHTVDITGDNHQLGTFDNVDHADYWDELVIIFTPKENKQIVDGAATVTMDGVDVTDSAWDYDESTGIGTVTLVVKGNVVIDIDFAPITAAFDITDKIDDAFIVYPTNTTVEIGEEFNAQITIPDYKYEFNKDSVKVTMMIDGVETDVTENVVSYEDSDATLKLAFTGEYLPVGAIKVTTGIKLIDFTVTVEGDDELVTLSGDTVIAYGNTATITVTPIAHYHFTQEVNVIESGSASYTLSEKQADGSYIIYITTGVEGNVRISVSLEHDNVSVTTSLSHIKFNFLTDPHEDIAYGSTVSGYFVADIGYNLPTTITVTCYGETLDVDEYTYDPENGSFEIVANGDIVISAAGSQGKVNFSLVNTNEEGKATLKNSLPAELDSGYTIDNEIEAPEGYAIKSVVVTMGGNVIKNAYDASTGGIYVYSISDDVVITVTTIKLHSVTYDIENVQISDHIEEVVDKGTYSLIILVDEGYELTEGAVSVMMGGEDITDDVLGVGTIFISEVTGDVEVSIKATKKSFSVTNTLTNASNSSAAITSVEYGASYQAVISALEGYENLSCSVKMGGVDVPCVNGVIIISKVTGAIEITASAVASKVNVSVDVTNVTCTIDSQQVDYNSSLEFKLTQDDNTFDYVYSVTMGGEPVDGLNGVYTIEHVTGEIVIEASATIIELESITASLEYPHNLIDYDSDFPMEWLEVIAHYNNGDSQEVTSGITIEGFERTVSGEQTITVKALGLETTVDVEVLESTVVVNVSANTVEESYDFGYEFTKFDVDVYIEMSDGITYVMMPDDISGYDITKSGEQSITVYCGEYELQITVKINASTEIESISAVANKDNLTYGDSFNASDVTVTARYTDGLTKEISAEYVEFLGAPGKNTVVVHAAGKTCTVEVTVKPSEVIDHIDALPNDISYAYGYELKASDFAVTATYTDGHIGTVDATSVVAEDLVPGLNVVEVKVGELSCNVVVKVDDSTEIASISAVIKDGKDTVAYEGAFTADDVTVYATYTDGKTKVVTGFTMSGFDNKHIGVNTVTITLGDKTCTVKVTVLASTVVDHIEATATKDNLTYGDTFTKDDVKVTEVYTDGHKVENLAADSISGFTGKVGVNNVTVVYGGKEASIQVTVKASEVIESIEAVVNEGKAELEYGAAFTKDDVTVTATYTDGNTAVVAADSVDFAGTVGENTVVVHVGDKTCEVKVTVKASEVITGIEVSTEKTNVEYGGTFTKDDVKAQYVYSDGNKVDATVDSISGFSATTLGKQVITVKVGEYSATLEITVSGRVALSIEVIGYNDTVDQGKDYVFTGKVIAHYNDGTTEEVTAYTMEAVDTSKAGKKTVKVSFENVSATFDINVIQTKTEIEPTYMTAIIGGSVVGVAILAVGIFLFLKSFKL
ncbi:MAG: bacterial Ig-like domain-containing protein [Bacilli bacterium]|nr:bacterial Ig-like domain-containing protein [Bacilli bacterium]